MVLRQRGGRRNPPPIQRMEADDLMAAAFPALAACQENAGAGPVEIPDHPMVRQTMYDCLHEATDVDGLVALLEALEAGRVRPHFVDSPEPSPLSHEILNGGPIPISTMRRSRSGGRAPWRSAAACPTARASWDASIPMRSPACATRRGRIRAMRGAARRAARAGRAAARCCVVELVRRAVPGRTRRVCPHGRGALWLATERREHVDALFPEAPVEPDVRLPASARSAGRPEIDEEAATVVMTRGYLATMGPATAADLALRVGRPVSAVEQALAKLEAEGFALRGRFDPERDEGDRAVEFCERRLLARIHRYTTDRLRREIEPVTAQDFMRFCCAGSTWRRRRRWRAAAASSP
jgi:ATP-dependent Lhr-like helicase